MAEVLNTAQILIWYFRWDTAPPIDLTLLSRDERSRYESFHFDRDRHAYLIAHNLVRRVLSQHCDAPETSWRFECNRYGKPFVASPQTGLYFSLSHTAGLAACAVSLHSEIGVDAERIDRVVDFLPLARRYFAPGEIAALESTAAPLLPERFLTLWTLKEAYIKARGMGLSLPLRDFEVRPQAGGAAAIARDADWRLRTFRRGAYVLSAAVHAPSPPEFILRDGAPLLQKRPSSCSEESTS